MKTNAPSAPLSRTTDATLRSAQVASRDRKLRERLFSHRSGLFCDPAWDMLVDLFIAHVQGRQIGTSSVCLAAGVPMTTALRHLDLLVKQGLVVRTVDPADRRRSFNRLTPTAVDEMTRYFEDAGR